MPHAYATVPSESDILCEGCGYVLNGLPAGTRCPECGKPTAESAAGLRLPPAWEQRAGAAGQVSRFLRTTVDVIVHPGRYYRSLVTRGNPQPSRQFARLHNLFAAVLFGSAAYVHFDWLLQLNGVAYRVRWPVLLAWSLATYVALVSVTWLAAKLTSWEAKYWGMRLPLPVVRRGLDYHTAHYLPVAVLTWVTVVGYALLRRYRLVDSLSDPAYLYTLCGEVVAAAVYLFRTYWIGMRNMMYANA